MERIKENLKNSNYKFVIVYAIGLIIQITGTLICFKKYTDEINELDVDDETFEIEVSKRESTLKLFTALGIINACIGSCVFMKFFKKVFGKED